MLTSTGVYARSVYARAFPRAATVVSSTFAKSDSTPQPAASNEQAATVPRKSVRMASLLGFPNRPDRNRRLRRQHEHRNLLRVSIACPRSHLRLRRQRAREQGGSLSAGHRGRVTVSCLAKHLNMAAEL